MGIEHHMGMLGPLHHCALPCLPDEDTGMWVVCPGRLPDPDGAEGSDHIPFITVINISEIIRAAHLSGVNTNLEVPEKMRSYESLDTYKMFFVNKFIDHHAFELLHPLPSSS